MIEVPKCNDEDTKSNDNRGPKGNDDRGPKYNDDRGSQVQRW